MQRTSLLGDENVVAYLGSTEATESDLVDEDTADDFS